MRKYLFGAVAAAALATPAFAADRAPQDFGAWLDEAVARNMAFPAALERSNASGIATLRFSVSGGRAVGVGLIRSSGDSTIDRAAIRTIATLDLPADAPAGPHVAVLQYGSAAGGADFAEYAAELQAARREARLALFSDPRQRLASRDGGASGAATTLD